MTDKSAKPEGEKSKMNNREECPVCGSGMYYLVVIPKHDQIRVDCVGCGNVVAVGNEPTIDRRMGEEDG